jgi:hypothetical protein
MSILSIILTGSNILANIAIILGVIIAIIQLLADHERRKKQATIEFYDQIFRLASPLAKSIRENFTTGYINPTEKAYSDNVEIQNNIRNYLSLMERISAGINIGVFDFSTFSRLAGTSTKNMHTMLYYVIPYLRQNEGNPKLFIEFEWLIKKIDNKTIKPPDPAADIRYS